MAKTITVGVLEHDIVVRVCFECIAWRWRKGSRDQKHMGEGLGRLHLGRIDELEKATVTLSFRSSRVALSKRR